jgi:hypothetical protein
MPSKAMDQRELSNPNPSPPSPSVSSRLHVTLRALHFHVYVVGSTKAGMEGQFVPCVTTEVGSKMVEAPTTTTTTPATVSL